MVKFCGFIVHISTRKHVSLSRFFLTSLTWVLKLWRLHQPQSAQISLLRPLLYHKDSFSSEAEDPFSSALTDIYTRQSLIGWTDGPSAHMTFARATAESCLLLRCYCTQHTTNHSLSIQHRLIGQAVHAHVQVISLWNLYSEQSMQ